MKVGRLTRRAVRQGEKEDGNSKIFEAPRNEIDYRAVIGTIY